MSRHDTRVTLRQIADHAAKAQLFCAGLTAVQEDLPALSRGVATMLLEEGAEP